jgi:periplasmic protein TonB
MKSILTITLLFFTAPFLFGQTARMVSTDTTVMTLVDSPPEYIGGEVALYTYIYQHLRFPPDPNMIECTVYVGFVVNENGTLSDIAVKKGFSNSYNTEAVKVIKSMPKWRGGKHEGQARKVACVLPIRFKIM